MVQTKAGNVAVSGRTLSPVAREFMKKYRQLQTDIEPYGNEKCKEIFLDKPYSEK